MAFCRSSPADSIAILTAPNSGSSLLAWIFEDHGLGFGECQERGRRGGENRKIKTWLLKRFGQLHLTGGQAVWDPDIIKVWDVECFKTFASFWPALPTRRFIKVRRKLESIIASSQAKNTYRGGDVWDLVSRQVGYLKGLPGPEVDMDAVVAGDYRTLAEAMSAFGIKFRPQVADELIDSSLYGGVSDLSN